MSSAYTLHTPLFSGSAAAAFLPGHGQGPYPQGGYSHVTAAAARFAGHMPPLAYAQQPPPAAGATLTPWAPATGANQYGQNGQASLSSHQTHLSYQPYPVLGTPVHIAMGVPAQTEGDRPDTGPPLQADPTVSTAQTASTANTATTNSPTMQSAWTNLQKIFLAVKTRVAGCFTCCCGVNVVNTTADQTNQTTETRGGSTTSTIMIPNLGQVAECAGHLAGAIRSLIEAASGVAWVILDGLVSCLGALA